MCSPTCTYQGYDSNCVNFGNNPPMYYDWYCPNGESQEMKNEKCLPNVYEQAGEYCCDTNVYNVCK